MNSFTRAAVSQGSGRPIDVQNLPIPELRTGEVLVRILCTTVCGSDLHTYYGRRSSPAPCILGHEMVGRVVAIGAGGATQYATNSAVQSGDRISWSMVWSCGSCFYCTHGLRPKCERLLKFGHNRIDLDHSLCGGFAHHCILPAGTAIFPVPDCVPDVVASSANCATATVAAMFRSAPAVQGQTLLVYGAGMLGLTACAMARHSGAARVIAIDTNPSRRLLAHRFGADTVLDGNLPGSELKQHVTAHSDGRGADIAFDLTGNPEAIEQGFDLVRPGGCFLLAGAVFPARPLSLSAEQIVRRMIRMEGVYNYAPEDLGVALDFLASSIHQYPYDELVERVFPLDAINEAFRHAEERRPPRVAVRPPFDS